MCGIFGILSPCLPKNGFIRKGLDAIRHRGPDDEGYLFLNTIGNNFLPASGYDTCRDLRDRHKDVSEIDVSEFDLVLGHRRLSIIDLSSRGHQPMSYADGDLFITYNGEIFNYRDLRAELQTTGYHFNSDTDTEVILAAYQEWGQQCVRRFNGQWAFCIYDRRNKLLFCSRDRFGVKPFYYWLDSNCFVFASEIKSITAMPFINTQLNIPLVSEFVIFCELDTSEETLCNGIYQLPPSHNLVVDLKETRTRTERYYELAYLDQIGDYHHKQALRYADDIRDLLVDSVRIRLISDVPVGSCLSGGLDSSSIVFIINKLLDESGGTVKEIGERQKTFTAAYDDPSVDERVHADEVIRNTRVDAYYSYPNAETFWNDLESFLYHQDGLCFSTNAYPEWDLMRLASRHIKVVLNGQGGDELFGGYPRYEILYLADMIRGRRTKDLFAALSGLINRKGFSQTALYASIGGFLALTPEGLKPFVFRKWFGEHHRAMERLLNKRFSIDKHLAKLIAWMQSLNQFLITDTTQTYLPQLLHYDDRNAAAFSIENRVPFTDHRLADYVHSIPSVYKVHKGWSKWLLRLAMRDLLPDRILWRKDKLGFPTPLRQWMTHGLSPVPQLMKKYGIRKYDHFLWRFFLADRLIGNQY